MYRSGEWLVQWGLTHRKWQGVESLGVDEIHWGNGLRADNFLTVIYQIDAGFFFVIVSRLHQSRPVKSTAD